MDFQQGGILTFAIKQMNPRFRHKFVVALMASMYMPGLLDLDGLWVWCCHVHAKYAEGKDMGDYG